MRFLIRKNQAGGISATDFFNSWNPEQYSYQGDLLGRWQARSNSKLGRNTGLIQDQTINSLLAPFMRNTTLTISAGIASWPADFAYQQALRINGQKVFYFDKDERWAIEDSVIDPPSIATDTYYYTEYGNSNPAMPPQYLFLPIAVTAAELDYIAGCTDVKWAYTFDGSGREQYDSGNSVQPQWGQGAIIEITKRTLKTLGVSFSSQDFEQFGQSIIATGD